MSSSSTAFQRAESSASASSLDASAQLGSHERAPSHRLGWRALLVTSLLAATAVGFAFGHSEAKALAVSDAGEDLTRLLQFMALVKTAMALAVAALVVWRLGHPIRAGLASAYVMATIPMFVAPGLIWQMQHVAAGALLFHGGLIGVLLLSAVDGAGRQSLKARFFPFALRGRRTPIL